MISLILFSDDITYYLASLPVYFLASRSQKIQHKAGFKGTAGKARHVTNLRLACRSIITYDNFVYLSIGLSVCPPLSLSLSLSLSASAISNFNLSFRIQQNPNFLRPSSRKLSKAMFEREKMPVISILFFSRLYHFNLKLTHRGSIKSLHLFLSALFFFLQISSNYQE